MTEPRDWDLRADELAAAAIGREQPTAWFDELYAEGRAGAVSMPWDRVDPQPLLKEWAEREGLEGAGRTAIVVGPKGSPIVTPESLMISSSDDT